jgi:hypothetical protein
MPCTKFTMRHIRQARICARGARAFFLQHGLDWNKFLREGLPVAQLDAIDDVRASQMAAAVRADCAL